MDDVTTALAAARSAYERRDWRAAHDGLLAAREEQPLDAGDLVALADATWWLGLTDESLAASEEAYHLYADNGEVCPAARLALDIGFLTMLRGQVATGSGWINRASRLLADVPNCVERALLLYTEFVAALAEGDVAQARDCTAKIQSIGRELHDRTVDALGLVCQGLTLIQQANVKQGLAVLDEAMLPVTAGLVEPEWAGNIYCQMMQTCAEVADVRRAREWTTATERWCDGFSPAVMFAGICRVHRAQLLLLEGAWAEAEVATHQVIAELADMNVEATAEAGYVLGELHRLRGNHHAAKAAYQEAHRLGRDPQPGSSLLRLAQGQPEVAGAALRTALLTTTNPFHQARLNAARVEVAVALGDVHTAREALAELEQVARSYEGGGLQAAACQAQGAVWLAEDSPEKAAPALREAVNRWHDLAAPCDVARARLLLAQACEALGDPAAAGQERAAAIAALTALGAAVPDASGDTMPAGLTSRELEVLACVAAGRRNREIAETLCISEKTVARHLSNMFTKLGVANRTEAAAYAFDHGLATGDG